ncbi:MAG: YdcF family protein [Actinomycetes bacterium]
MVRRKAAVRRRGLFVALLAVIACTLVTLRVFVYPPLRPVPGRVDAIIELGGAGDRDREALRLARAGVAPVLVQSTVPQEAGTSRCLPAVHDVTVMCFHPDPDTTRGEAHWISAQAAQHGWKSVVLVTSPDQAWRAILRVGRCFPGDVYASTTPLPPASWLKQVPYQWVASAKALLVERDC